MSFDPITLAMAKPKILDMTQFSCTHQDVPITFNDAIMILFSECLTSGGGLKKATVDDAAFALRNAASGDGNFRLRISINDSYTDYSVAFSHASDGTAYQMGTVGMMSIPPYGELDLKLYIQFNFTTDVNIGVYVKPVA